jgi:hypothetical protein
MVLQFQNPPKKWRFPFPEKVGRPAVTVTTFFGGKGEGKMSSEEALLLLGEAQRVLQLVQNRDTLLVESLAKNPHFTNNDLCLRYISRACQKYLDGTRTLLNSFDVPQDGPQQLRYKTNSTVEEVKDMFCSLIRQFSSSLVELHSVYSQETTMSLLTVGDDALDNILSFLPSEDLFEARQTCRNFRRKAESRLLRAVEMEANQHGEVNVCVEDALFWELHEEELFPLIEYSSTEELTMQVCCPTHCMIIMLEVVKIPKVKKFSIVFSDCDLASFVQNFRWLRTFLNKHKRHLESLAISLPTADEVDNSRFEKVAEIVSGLEKLKSLSIYVDDHNLEVVPFVPLDVSFLRTVSSSVESISLNFGCRYILNGLASFGWENCTSMSLSQLGLPIADWRVILNKLHCCETMKLNRLFLSDEKMGLAEFFSYRVMLQLRKLVIKAESGWVSTSNYTWVHAQRFPRLEHLSLEGNFSSTSIVRLCRETSILQELYLSVKGDEFVWNPQVSITEIDVIRKFELIAAVLPNLVDLRIAFSKIDDGKFLVTTYGVEDLFKSRIASAERVKELFPQLKRFRYTPPGVSSGSSVFDLNAYIALNEVTVRAKSDVDNYHERIQLSARNLADHNCGVKRRRIGDGQNQ